MKDNIYKLCTFTSAVIFMLISGCSGDGAPANNAPTAKDVVIIDDNGGRAFTGDSLTGSYTYYDMDGDAEKISVFRWLRNGAVINNANNTTYTLTADDSGKSIVFEVIAVAATGIQAGDVVQSEPIDAFSGFVDSLQLLGDSHSTSIALGDVDSDGDLDMVVANLGQGNRVYFNNSMGVFFDSGQSLGAYDSSSIALGDVDGDGDLDMVVANGGNIHNPILSGSRVYTNDGRGYFTDSDQSLGTDYGTSVVLGDLDGDGDLDLVEGTHIRPTRVFLNDSVGNFSDSGQSLVTSSNTSVVLGDLDGDGDLDLLVGNSTQSKASNRAYLNDGAGNFTYTSQSITVDNSHSVALGDIDGDNDLDMVSAGGVYGDRVWTNDGTGYFYETGQSWGASNSTSVVLGDVDSDGDLDMVMGQGIRAGNRIYTNDGVGRFTDSSQSLGSYHTLSIALGDVDGDGDLDMVAANGKYSNFGIQDQANRVYLYK